MLRLGLLIAAVSFNLSESAPAEHLIDALPGWNHPLPSRTYSGYVDAGKSCQQDQCYTMHEHYVFVESENSPSSDPLVLWTNGGPGAASLYGLFVELGPFYLSDRSMETIDYNKTGVPTLFRNEYSWSKFANLLIINSPPPVGFSYCDPAGPAGNGFSCGAWNDTRTAEHNLIFLKNWFRLFPEYNSNKFFLTGESYAGIYVPTLARAILTDNSKEAASINLAGWAVGDACMGTEVRGTPPRHPAHSRATDPSFCADSLRQRGSLLLHRVHAWARAVLRQHIRVHCVPLQEEGAGQGRAAQQGAARLCGSVRALSLPTCS